MRGALWAFKQAHCQITDTVQPGDPSPAPFPEQTGRRGVVGSAPRPNPPRPGLTPQRQPLDGSQIRAGTAPFTGPD